VKIVICCPTVTRPYAPFLAALEASVPVLDAAGIEHQTVYEVGNPYISGARAVMTRKALDAGADVIVYVDHDVSWEPANLLKLVQTEGDVVAGVYRFKSDTEEYMGAYWRMANGQPKVREDGAICGSLVPAGFLKVTADAIDKFMAAYPELAFGSHYSPSVDLFNHGVVLGDRTWYGEDYCFSKRYSSKCGPLWIVPDMNITHHGADGKEYPGNYHQYLLRCPGGSESANPNPEFAK
jgi:hypothetical protein